MPRRLEGVADFGIDRGCDETVYSDFHV